MLFLVLLSLLNLTTSQVVYFYSDSTCTSLLNSVTWSDIGCSKIPQGALGAIVDDCPPISSCGVTDGFKGLTLRDNFGDCDTAMYLNYLAVCPCTWCGDVYGNTGLGICFNLTLPTGDKQWGINSVYLGRDTQFYLESCNDETYYD
jgi:hypothetical protein